MFRMKKRTGSAGKVVSVLLAAILVSGILIPSNEVEAKTKTKIALSPAKITLKVKETKKLTLKNGKKKITKGVKFSSSKKKVATVSKKGVVTALKKGSAKITAKYKGKSYICKVTVKAAKKSATAAATPTPAPTSAPQATAAPQPTAAPTAAPAATQRPSLAIDATVSEINALRTVKLTLKNNAVVVTKDITWTSSDNSIATVAEDGTVTGVSKGSATITASYLGATATKTITVRDPLVSVKNTSVSILPGQTEKIIFVDNGNEIEVTGATFKSADESVASVSADGTITANKAGTTTVTASLSGKNISIQVKVEQVNYSISQSEATLKLASKETVQLNVKDGSNNVNGVTWKSSNDKIATVSSTGLVTPVGSGIADITASIYGNDYICTVTVVDFDFSRDVKVTKSSTVKHIEFVLNTETITEEQLKEQDPEAVVTDGVVKKDVECDVYTFEFQKLPTSLEEIKAFKLDNECAPVAANICAFACTDTTKNNITEWGEKHPAFAIYDYLNGPASDISAATKSSMFHTMLKSANTGRLAYFQGATPKNGYTPTTPYTLTMYIGPYYIPAKEATIGQPQGTPERFMVLFSFAGDDSERMLDVYKSSDGNWYSYENQWQHIVASFKPVQKVW